MNELPASRRNRLERNWNSVWNNSTGRIKDLLRASREGLIHGLVILMYLLVTITYFFSPTFYPLLVIFSAIGNTRLSWLQYICPLSFPMNYSLYHFFVFLLPTVQRVMV